MLAMHDTPSRGVHRAGNAMRHPWVMAPSAMHHLVVLVLRLQGRKKRWLDGAKLVETARAEHQHGPVSPPEWIGRRARLSTDHSAGFAVHTLAPLVESPGAPTVLYLHGGGYIHDFAVQHWRYLCSVVEGTGATVIAPQYPLAPDHTWRDSFETVIELARGVGVVMGDSAGGGYALAVAQTLAAEGIARDAVLIAPAIDMTLSSVKTAEYEARDPWLASDGIHHAAAAWAGGGDISRYELSPLFGSFHGLGRVLVFSGTRDMLHPQVRQLQRRLPTAQVVTEPGCVHVYPLLPIPEAARAMRILENFLRL
jgi:monoterpene epsilon-lactone hydrolase